MALIYLLNGLADPDVQRENRLRLWDLKSTEVSWSRTIDMSYLIEAEARARRLRAPNVATVGAANNQKRPHSGAEAKNNRYIENASIRADDVAAI